jgi:HEAT repeat protein
MGEIALPVLCEALSNTSDEIIWRTVIVLGELKAGEAVSSLIRLLDRPGIICECAIWSLGEIGDPRATTALLRFLNAKDPVVKREAEAALGKIGNRK